MPVLQRSQSTYVRPFVFDSDGSPSKACNSPPLGVAKRLENVRQEDNFYRINTEDMSKKKYQNISILTTKGKIPEKLHGLHSKLYAEVEKIQKWKVLMEIENQQKTKKLQDAFQTIESQRKVLLELQLQNENLSLQITEELHNRNEILQKVHSTRELCVALKDHFERLQDKINCCDRTKEMIEDMNDDRMKSYEDLARKFQELQLDHVEKLTSMNNMLIAGEHEIKHMKASFNSQLSDAGRQLESLHEIAETRNTELRQLHKELDQEKLHCENLIQEKDKLQLELLCVKEEKLNQSCEINQLKATVKAMQSEKEEQDANLLSTSQFLKNLQIEKEEVEKQLKDSKLHFEEEIAYFKSHLSKLEEELKEERERVKEEQNKVEVSSCKIQEMKIAQDNFKMQIAQANHDLEKQKELREELEKLQINMDTVLKEKEIITKDLNVTKEQLKEKESSFDSLHLLLKDEEKLRSDLEIEIIEFKKQLDEKETEIKAIRMQEEAVCQKLLLREETCSVLSLEKADLHKTIMQKEQELIILSEEKKSLIQGIENEKLVIEESKNCLIEKTSSMEDDLASQKKIISDLEAEVKSLRSKLDTKEQTILEIQNSKSTLSADLHDKQSKLDALLADREQEKQELMSLRDQVVDKEHELIQLQNEVSAQAKHISELLKQKEEEKEVHKMQIKEVMQILDQVQKDYRKDMMANEGELQKLRNQIDKLQDQLRFGDDKETEIQSLKKEREEYKALIGELKTKKETEIQSLKKEREEYKVLIGELKTKKDAEAETLKKDLEKCKTLIAKLKAGKVDGILKLTNTPRCTPRKQVAFMHDEECDTSASEGVEIELDKLENTLKDSGQKLLPRRLTPIKPKNFPAARVAPHRRSEAKLLPSLKNDPSLDIKNYSKGSRKAKYEDNLKNEVFQTPAKKPNKSQSDSNLTTFQSTPKSVSGGQRKFFKSPRGQQNVKLSGLTTGLSWFDLDATYEFFADD